jgi:hypothetical protein
MAVARKAFVGVCRHVRADGVITDACAGSGIFWDFNYYATRAHPDDEPHGRGPVMMAGAEILSAKPPQ